MRTVALSCVGLALMGSVLVAVALPSRFDDPLQTPSTLTALSGQTRVEAVAPAGGAFVAVGPRGHILLHTAGNDQWKQVATPVSTDLVAVSFPSAKQGWAVGHDGVVLHSIDAGVSWHEQLNGRTAFDAMLRFYQARAREGDSGAQVCVKRLERIAAQAVAWPFLDVWFRNDDEGYIVGAFGLIMKTSDGGKSWQPLLDRMDNPKHYHLYSIEGGHAGIFIAGEQGLLMKLDATSGRFEALKTPYSGSYFGVAMTGSDVVIYGLRGHAFVSGDQGVNWQKLETGTDVGIAGAAVLPDHDVVLAAQDGSLLRVKHGDHTVVRIGNVQRQVFGVSAAGADQLAVATDGGPEFFKIGTSR